LIISIQAILYEVRNIKALFFHPLTVSAFLPISVSPHLRIYFLPTLDNSRKAVDNSKAPLHAYSRHKLNGG